jgi:hypothetical protein
VTTDDDELAHRLDGALRSGLAGGPVDAQALLAGSHRRATRVRQRRLAGVGAAVALVLAVPVGYEVMHPGASDTAPPAALLPSSPATTAGSTGRPTGPRPSPVAIPGSLSLTAAELPAGLKPELDLKGANVATVPGQQCQSLAAAGLRPVAGRQWTWTDGSGRTTALTVSLIVTRWAPGTGTTAFDDLAADTGYCRWSDPQALRPFAPSGVDDAWAATSSFSTLRYGRAAIRIGDLIAAVEVQHPGGVKVAAELAEQLVTDVSRRSAAR